MTSEDGPNLLINNGFIPLLIRISLVRAQVEERKYASESSPDEKSWWAFFLSALAHCKTVGSALVGGGDQGHGAGHFGVQDRQPLTRMLCPLPQHQGVPGRPDHNATRSGKCHLAGYSRAAIFSRLFPFDISITGGRIRRFDQVTKSPLNYTLE